MINKIVKRDGREVSFDIKKITDAISKAAVAEGEIDSRLPLEITVEVINHLEAKFPTGVLTVEDIQDMVEQVLIEKGHTRVAKAYIIYRNDRTRIREARSDLMDAVAEILVETSKENANVSNSPSAKMLQIASAASKAYYLDRVIPSEMAKSHSRGDFHIHDLDFYGKTLTCVQIPLGKLLKSGFNNGHGFIRSPKRPGSAAALAAIILQSSQNDMHGGQSFAYFDRDMAPYVNDASEEETFQAMEALIYNLNSMHSRAGAQVPFSSLNLGVETDENARKITRNVLLAYEKGLGHGENPIFPNIIFRVKEGINLNPEDPNYDLFQLALRVAAKRLNPTFSFMDSTFNSPFGTEVGYMGCRTRVMSNCCGPEETDGRGNLSFTTINLPRLAIRAKGDLDQFFKNVDEMVELTIQQLLHRYKVQANLRVKDMPFLMGQKLYLDSDHLKMEDKIETAIKHGSLSLGFIGLAETLAALTGKHHGESVESNELGHRIVGYLRQLMDEAVEKYNLNFSLLATPAEGLSGRFVRMDQKEFGIIPGVTDKEYYTNSLHVPVGHPISMFEKMKIEGAYHKYANAGHIAYIEFSSSPIHNLSAVESLIRYMKECDIGYAGINFPIDFCNGCGYFGVIDGDSCPNCKTSVDKRVKRPTIEKQ
ncbi:MAG: anaerobic ribonucleoside-triphosphate reductase [Negativicutes bacterium]|nr:anaerobic ribonucleoside-triphosphate reductase [Negativicutes bacterium]